MAGKTLVEVKQEACNSGNLRSTSMPWGRLSAPSPQWPQSCMRIETQLVILGKDCGGIVPVRRSTLRKSAGACRENCQGIMQAGKDELLTDHINKTMTN